MEGACRRSLERWVEVLFDGLASHDTGATLIRLDHDGSGEHELGLLPIDGHPTEVLAGYDAPASCYALGVATGGWAAPMDGTRPSAHPEARRVFHVLLVDRTGDVAARVRFPDGSVMDSPAGGGAVLDALRRALGSRRRRRRTWIR